MKSHKANEGIVLNIGVFHPPIHPKYFGGSVPVTVSIVNALIENGYSVILFVSDKIDQKKLNEMMGERISLFVKTIVKPSLIKPRSFIDLYESAFKLLALKVKCDIVIDTYSNYIFPWTDVCYVHSIARAMEGRLTNVVNLPYVLFERNFQRYNKKLLLTNSHLTAKAIKESLGTNAKVLYPPVSTIFFQNNYSTFEEDQRENLVVTIARINRWKKVEIIPHIANMLREENIKFVIMGFSHDKETLRAINTKIKRLDLRDKVTILTDISKEKMKNTLERTKVYFHPPTVESFGISIAEAMAMGCLPIVYNEGGAVREFVPEELRYESLYDASEKIKKAINQWSAKKAREINAIAKRFADPNFRKNFIKFFSDYKRIRF